MKRENVYIFAMACLVVLASALSGCDAHDFKKARKQGTSEAFREYIRKHPQGKFTAYSWSMIEQETFKRVQRQNTVAAYQGYLEEYPDGKFKPDAKREINLLCTRWAQRLSPEELAQARIVVTTSMGPFSFRFFPDEAPAHARNILLLAVSGFYRNQAINTVQKGVMVHMGDPTDTGLGGPGFTIPFETNKLRHVRGAVSMYHLPMDPDSAGSQFFVILSEAPQFDGKFSVFGEVVEGLETLDQISEVKVLPGGGRASVTPETPITIDKFEVEGVELPE